MSIILVDTLEAAPAAALAHPGAHIVVGAEGSYKHLYIDGVLASEVKVIPRSWPGRLFYGLSADAQQVYMPGLVHWSG